MTASVLLVCLMLGGARALVDLNCSDNATCIEAMGRDLVKSLREQKSVRLFELLTIEPLSRRQGRSSGGLWSLMENHAMSFDWNDFTFRFALPQDGKDDALDMEMYDNRSIKEEADPSIKKSSSKVEDAKEEDKTPKMGLHRGVIRRKRRQKKKVLQAVIPLLFGMKTAGAVIFAFALVTILTMKAFVASKMALLVTIGMALKRLYESYSTGVGFQNHPYLYSQYPIDFPSASSHAYSVSGVSPQFASNEMYSPNMLDPQTQELLQQQQDASAQQSQQAPLLINSTHAAERWDGKSKFQKLLEPFIDGFKNVINPIANIFYGAIPTFRGLNTEVSTDKSVEDTVEEVKEKKPKEYLVPQPRFIAQRKNFVKMRSRPKKYTELKIDLDKLKRNKDFQEYIKTKKYKHNYPNTYYYPRVKYVLHNPNNFYAKPNNSRLVPYSKSAVPTETPTESTPIIYAASEWKPIVVYNNSDTINTTSILSPSFNVNPINLSIGKHKRILRRFFRKKLNSKQRKRIKRDVSLKFLNQHPSKTVNNEGRGFLSIFNFISDFFSFKSSSNIIHETNEITKSTIEESIVPVKAAPLYYSTFYNALMITIDVMEGLFGVQKDLNRYYFNDDNQLIKKKKKYKKKSNPKDNTQKLDANETKPDVLTAQSDKTKVTKCKKGTKKNKPKQKKKNTTTEEILKIEDTTTENTVKADVE